MSKRLSAKASLIQLPELDAAPPAAAPAVDASPEPAPMARSRTAPGTMAHFLVAQSSAVSEAGELREQLKAFEGAQPARRLDPQRIRPSRWANRHASSFEGAAFAELREEIGSAGGNVQPIKVRPLKATDGGSGGEHDHEVVFGLRRHRACLELGLPVLAIVEELEDLQLFEEMERENRSRANLSPWEQGMMYRRALDEGLFSSQRKLAEALGVDLALVSKSLALARLPDAVVAAFATPLEIQYRWAQPLAEAVQKDPDGVLARAREINAMATKPASKAVLERLLGFSGKSAGSDAVVLGEGARSVRWQPGGKGAVRVDVPAGALTARQLDALQEWLRKALLKRD